MEQVKRWHKHYPKEIPLSLQYDEKPLYNLLLESEKRYGDNPALYFMGKSMSYTEVLLEAKKLATYFQKHGLKKDERVAIMLPNCPQAVIAYFGVLLAGGIVVQTNPLYTVRELEYQLKDCSATFIICLDILLPSINKIFNNTSLKHVIVTEIKSYLPFPKNIIYPFIQKRQYEMIVKIVENDHTHNWERIMRESSPDYTVVPIDPSNDIALIQYTGGTTGTPKGAILTHANLVSNVQMCKAWLYKTEEGKEVILGVLPFFHVYGMTTVMNLSIMIGGKMVLLPKFEREKVLKMIEKQKVTLFPGAPTIYISLLNDPMLKKYNLSSVEACISGAAPLPKEIQEQFEEVTGGRLVEGYGLTESSPVTHANFLWSKRISRSIGVPWPDTDAKIVKPGTLEEVEIGDIGEVIIKGPQVMKGYWNNDKATKSTLIDGWLFTGDMGYMDEKGYFYIVDRKSDMIIASGYNVYPREVEEVLYEHDGIQEVSVVGVPDDYRGETVAAYIVVKPGVNLTKEELDTHCRKYLAAYKVPRIYEFKNELPKTAIGKVLKRELIKQYK